MLANMPPGLAIPLPPGMGMGGFLMPLDLDLGGLLSGSAGLAPPGGAGARAGGGGGGGGAWARAFWLGLGPPGGAGAGAGAGAGGAGMEAFER